MSDPQPTTTTLPGPVLDLPACSCPSPTQIPDGGHPRSCPRYQEPGYRIEYGPPQEDGRAVQAYDGDALVLDGVLVPRRPQATLPAKVCNWTNPGGFERGMDARAQIEAEANRPPSDGWSSTPPPSGDMHVRDLDDDGNPEWVLLFRWMGEDSWRCDIPGKRSDDWARGELLMGWQFLPVNLSHRDIKPDNPQRWSSTPPTSGDMHALTPTQGIQYLNWIRVYQCWASMGMRHSREWLMAQGWQFRPADSAAAPGIHQAAMEERLHTVGYRLDALRHCIGSPGTNLVRGQQLAETLANDAHWLKLLADELLAKEVCADAGQVYDDLAEDCMRAVVAWQGS